MIQHAALVMQSFMLDYDLAEMYGVETRVLNQAVKRNLSRFESRLSGELSYII